MGQPIAKARPRVCKHGTYTPKRTADYENLVRAICLECNPEPLEGHLRATIDFYMQIPKSRTKADKEKMGTGEIRPTPRPDLDNLIKSILDPINGIAYKDDSQVVEIVARKFYSDRPRAEVIIEEEQ